MKPLFEIGEEVILIARNSNYDSGLLWWSPDMPHPPIGAEGVITEGLDDDGDYEIDFHDHPCPVEPPAWVIHKSMIIKKPKSNGKTLTEFMDELKGMTVTV